MGFFDFFKSKKGGIEKISTLSPEQQKMFKQMMPYLQQRMGVPGAEAMTPWETRGLGMLEEVAGGEGIWGERGAALSDILEMGVPAGAERMRGARAGTLEDILGRGVPEAGAGIWGERGKMLSDIMGMAPAEGARAWYEEEVLPTRERIFAQKTLPALAEYTNLLGRGTAVGTMMGEAGAGFTAETAEDIYKTMMRGPELALQAAPMAGEQAWMPTQMALQAMGPAAQMAGEAYRPREMALAGMPAAAQQAFMGPEALMQYGGIARAIEQQNILNALQAMGIQTQAAFYKPGQASPFSQLLTGAAPMIGSYFGAKAGATPKKPLTQWA